MIGGKHFHTSLTEAGLLFLVLLTAYLMIHFRIRVYGVLYINKEKKMKLLIQRIALAVSFVLVVAGTTLTVLSCTTTSNKNVEQTLIENEAFIQTATEFAVYKATQKCTAECIAMADTEVLKVMGFLKQPTMLVLTPDAVIALLKKGMDTLVLTKEDQFYLGLLLKDLKPILDKHMGTVTLDPVNKVTMDHAVAVALKILSWTDEALKARM
jgi:hypothetical protein